jgi:hypothetical protein
MHPKGIDFPPELLSDLNSIPRGAYWEVKEQFQACGGHFRRRMARLQRQTSLPRQRLPRQPFSLRQDDQERDENFQYYFADEKKINAFLAAAPDKSTLCFLQLFRPFADEKEINEFLGLEAISQGGYARH